MNRGRVALMLALCLMLMSGCEASSPLEQALGKIGEDIKAAQVDTPQSASGETDWSYVQIVRDMATQTFMAGFPEAEITESSVATRNLDKSRVIVVLSYTLGDKSGEYGFDYRLGEDGVYTLERYGDGVSADDL
ncbi:MAG: hypothetical protein Q4G52_07165 [Clostridia bacterium]|nr:hypothetical protein [Clostridia bacterium]